MAIKECAMGPGQSTVDPAEVFRFGERADAWWDPEGSFFALHKLNPVRLGFIRSRLATHFGRDPSLLRLFTGLSLIDIGCGGGLVTEPMARLGFSVTGIDPSPKVIAQAREHARAGNLDIDYRAGTIEEAAFGLEQFDVVLALEVIEHVADRDAFLHRLGSLVAPGGAAIVATLNRTARSLALAIVGAEYVLGWIPRGTHHWQKFVSPSELILGLGRNRLRALEIAGVSYRLGDAQWRLSEDIKVNYLVVAAKA
jgi:2-polyprenyl-6-hydroxyphenyl methylase / 3-demethylubiquinone-9 3-methyltransferase